MRPFTVLNLVPFSSLCIWGAPSLKQLKSIVLLTKQLIYSILTNRSHNHPIMFQIIFSHTFFWKHGPHLFCIFRLNRLHTLTKAYFQIWHIISTNIQKNVVSPLFKLNFSSLLNPLFLLWMGPTPHPSKGQKEQQHLNIGSDLTPFLKPKEIVFCSIFTTKLAL